MPLGSGSRLQDACSTRRLSDRSTRQVALSAATVDSLKKWFDWMIRTSNARLGVLNRELEAAVNAGLHLDKEDAPVPENQSAWIGRDVSGHEEADTARKPVKGGRGRCHTRSAQMGKTLIE